MRKRPDRGRLKWPSFLPFPDQPIKLYRPMADIAKLFDRPSLGWGGDRRCRSLPGTTAPSTNAERCSILRGERTVRLGAAGKEGVYALIQRGRNLHLTYEIELPLPAG